MTDGGEYPVGCGQSINADTNFGYNKTGRIFKEPVKEGAIRKKCAEGQKTCKIKKGDIKYYYAGTVHYGKY